MLDIKWLRSHPDEARARLRDRVDEALLQQLEETDRRLRQVIQQAESLRAQQHALQQEGAGPAKRRITESDRARLRQLAEEAKQQEQQRRELEEQLDGILLRLPNLPDVSVPQGKDERDNVEVRRWGTPKQASWMRPHWEVGASLGLDFERAAKVSGARFVFERGAMARLERALINFMLDLHVQQHGYEEMFPPFLVTREAMTGTGQLPKFAEDAFRTAEDELYLVPTAEVPVTNYHRGEILDGATLPRKYVAYSACFRREAGSAGRDTRGLIRMHQFNKVEMVNFVAPGDSYAALEAMVQDAEEVLQRLQLPYRVVALCTGDLGFSAAKTYDLEVWMPTQQTYREISSCSNCEAFQARRANIRFRARPTSKPEYVHTLNGSGLAVGRTVAALLENGQQPDGSVLLPEALIPYIGVDRLVLTP